MKCIRNIQDEWRHKEQECEEEKVLLQKQIRLRALRNEEKDQVQNLLIKNTKKANGIDSQAWNKNHRFYRELTNIEANLLGTRVKTGEIGRFDMKT